MINWNISITTPKKFDLGAATYMELVAKPRNEMFGYGGTVLGYSLHSRCLYWSTLLDHQGD